MVNSFPDSVRVGENVWSRYQRPRATAGYFEKFTEFSARLSVLDVGLNTFGHHLHYYDI